jgi:hypothetical protein
MGLKRCDKKEGGPIPYPRASDVEEKVEEPALVARARQGDAAAWEARKHPAAHPAILVTSSEKGLGMDRLRAAVLEAALV